MCDQSTSLEEVITEYLRSIDADHEVDRKALTKRHPDLAAELEEFFENHDRMEGIAHDVRAGAVNDPAEAAQRFLGDYELIEEIARGGMGVIWKARQMSLNRIVALKMILPAQAAGSEYVRRFRTEAESVAELSHKNIVPIYEIGEQQGKHFFSMKLIEGGDLSGHVEAFKRDHRAAVRLMITVAHAIRFAHQRGILHRDLKPANILLDDNGEPHITDFGLAKRDTDESSLTMTGAVIGTARYMAPEQASGNANRLTWAADVYSLGAILYELLTGVPPFRAATIHRTLQQVCNEEPVKPSTRNRTVGRDLETICLKCLEKDHERRYESAKAFADDLDRWLRGYPIQARRIGPAARAWRWCRRNRALAGLLVSTCVLLFLAMTLFVVEIVEIQKTPLLAQRDLAETRAEFVGIELNRYRRAVKDILDENENQLSPKLKAKDWASLQDLIAKQWDERRLENTSPFASLFVIDPGGWMRARSPTPTAQGAPYAERDYFKGTMTEPNGEQKEPYVSMVYKAESDQRLKFGISLPIMSDGKMAGVLAASSFTVNLQELVEGEREVVSLVARQDPRALPGDAPPTSAYVLLERVGMGEDLLDEPKDFPAAQLTVITNVDRTAKNYRDPVVGGEWLAVSAPVKGTHFHIIVQRKYAGAFSENLWIAIVSGLVITLTILGAFLLVRRTGKVSEAST
jgi:serine/threonine-protein kinase